MVDNERSIGRDPEDQESIRGFWVNVPAVDPGFPMLLGEVLARGKKEFRFHIEVRDRAIDPSGDSHIEDPKAYKAILTDSSVNAARIRQIHAILVDRRVGSRGVGVMPSALIDDALHGVVSNITSLLNGNSDERPLHENDIESLQLTAINKKLNPSHGDIGLATAVPVIGASLEDFEARRVELEERKVTPMEEERMRVIVAKDVEWILEARPDLKPIPPLRPLYLFTK